MLQTTSFKIGALAVGLALLASVEGGVAKTTVVPGGANQTAGVSGTLSQVLFNGKLRLRGMTFKEAGATDKLVQPAQGGERVFVFRAVVSNGTKREDHSYFNASLGDADGITIAGKLMDDGWSLEPGAAARTGIEFYVPSAFKPTKIVLIEAAASNAKAFRINLRASDLPTP